MRVPVPDELLPADRLGRVHFVGIGGAGLSGIARIMLARGIPVSGSDAKESRTLEALRALGARCYVGHAAEQVTDADTLVVSTAVREDNPEVVEARERGLRLLPRSAALDSVMQGRTVVAVAGTHGKTTTTSLLTVALQHCGADPSFAIGGELNESGSNAHDGSGRVFVAEADESDGAFLVYSPFGALVTNVEADHLDNYGTEEAYHAAFSAFLDRIDPAGFLVACVDDDGAADLAEQAREKGLNVTGVGESPRADLRAEGLSFAGSLSTFTVVDRGRRLGDVTLRIPGRHYVLDALAALAAGLRLGFPFADLRRGLEAFSGTRRRMELKGEVDGVRVYDSYAHHPTEIAADIAAMRPRTSGRVFALFQPHTPSRLRAFFDGFADAIASADQAFVAETFSSARERPDPEGLARRLAERAGGIYVADAAAGARALAERAASGDLALILGAGDIRQAGVLLLEMLRSRVPA